MPDQDLEPHDRDAAGAGSSSPRVCGLPRRPAHSSLILSGTLEGAIVDRLDAHARGRESARHRRDDHRSPARLGFSPNANLMPCWSAVESATRRRSRAPLAVFSTSCTPHQSHWPSRATSAPWSRSTGQGAVDRVRSSASDRRLSWSTSAGDRKRCSSLTPRSIAMCEWQSTTPGGQVSCPRPSSTVKTLGRLEATRPMRRDLAAPEPARRPRSAGSCRGVDRRTVRDQARCHRFATEGFTLTRRSRSDDRQALSGAEQSRSRENMAGAKQRVVNRRTGVAVASRHQRPSFRRRCRGACLQPKWSHNTRQNSGLGLASSLATCEQQSRWSRSKPWTFDRALAVVALVVFAHLAFEGDLHLETCKVELGREVPTSTAADVTFDLADDLRVIHWAGRP